MNDSIRSALVNVIKSNRKSMTRAQRKKGIKTQRWLYPLATEKRYAGAYRAWLRPLKTFVHEYLKQNQEYILRGDSVAGNFRADAADTISVKRLDAVPGRTFKIMINSMSGWLGQYVPEDDESISASPIYLGLGNIADSTFNFNEAQYEKSAKSVLGVEFPVGEMWWKDARENWAQMNYHLISGDMRNYVRNINSLVERAVTSGFTARELAGQIKALDDKISNARANFIARDQIGKLNGQITQRRMEEVGLSMYIWETSGDERVRGNPAGKYPDSHPSHYAMDGLLCRWDDSSVYSDDDGKTWRDRPSAAVHLHPGEDYQCRCTAIAYWQELVDEADAQIDDYEHFMQDEGTKTQNTTETKESEKRWEISDKLENCKTIPDLEDYARNEMGVKMVDLNGLDPKAVKGTFAAMEAAINNYPKLKGQIAEIGQTKEGIMSSRLAKSGKGLIINFNPYHYKNIELVKKAYNNGLQKGYYPRGTDWRNAGVHELGHIAHGSIVIRTAQHSWQVILDWKDHDTPKRIVSTAWRNIKTEYPKGTRIADSARGISGRADFTKPDSSYSETVAEAFSDVFSNGKKAQPLSRAIVDILTREM